MTTFVGTQPPHIPNCCKMWFPMTEKSGPDIIDIAGWVKMLPTSMSFETQNAIRLVIGTGFFNDSTKGVAPVSGTLPVIGTKSFVLFGVNRFSNELGRANTYFGFHDANGAYLGVFDGDGAMIMQAANAAYVAGSESFAGQDGYPYWTSNALIRDVNAVGNWVMPESPTPSQGNMVGPGDVYSKFARNNGFTALYPAGTFGNNSRNDYDLPAEVVTSWNNLEVGTGTNLETPITEWNGMTFGNAGLPGMWSYIDPAYSVGTLEKLFVSANLAGHNDYYGIALFVFESGLPADTKEALRWMTRQWIAGNKQIWPGWANL